MGKAAKNGFNPKVCFSPR